MANPKIILKFDNNQSILSDFLTNIGSTTTIEDDANVVLTDNPNSIIRKYINFVLTDDFGNGYISIPKESDPQRIYQIIIQYFSAIPHNESPKSCGTIADNKEEEIVAGFTRHFSHNVLNSLLITSGFMRQIKANSEMTKQLTTLWEVVDGKLLFIEELVRGYSDYYQVLGLQVDKEADVCDFFTQLIPHLALKDFERSFSACLGNHTSSYELEFEQVALHPHLMKANILFLKMAFCYLMKDTIRYASSKKPLSFFVSLNQKNDSLEITIKARDINISGEIINSMFKPWEHSMFIQSFDYWGVAIAKIIIEKHNGSLIICNKDNDLTYKIIL